MPRRNSLILKMIVDKENEDVQVSASTSSSSSTKTKTNNKTFSSSSAASSSSSRKNKDKSSSKSAVPEESSLADRRKLRQELRNTHEFVLDNREELSKLHSELYVKVRRQNNETFKKLTHNREQYLDALTLKELARAANAQTIKLDDMGRRFDFATLAGVCKDTYDGSANSNDNSDGFSWSNLGNHVGKLFRSLPDVNVMHGPLSKVFVARKIAQRRERSAQEDLEMVRPDEILTQSHSKSSANGGINGDLSGEQQQDDDAEAEATNERINHLVNYLETSASQLKAKNKSARMDLLSTIVDPQDCVQTVENFFDFAFLVKDKRVVQKYDNKKHTTQILVVEPETMEDDSGLSRKQMVLSLHMSDLKMIGDFEAILADDANRDIVSNLLSSSNIATSQESLMSTSTPALVSSNAKANTLNATTSNKTKNDSNDSSGKKRKGRESNNTNSNNNNNNMNASPSLTMNMNIPTTCPLHRNDELYHLKDARSQAELLLQRADNKVKVKKTKNSRGAGSSQVATTTTSRTLALDEADNIEFDDLNDDDTGVVASSKKGAKRRKSN